MPRPARRHDLTLLEKLEIVAYLQVRLKPDGTHAYGAKTAAALQFKCHRNTTHSMWEQRNDLVPARPVRALKYSDEEISEPVAAVPVHERTSLCSTAAGAGIPTSTLHVYVGKNKPLRRATAHVKPAVTPEHKRARLIFALEFVERPIGLRNRRFDPMYNVIHIDEKWFYLYKTATSYILTTHEVKPHVPCPNKRFITKVMFLAVVARPRYDCEKKRGFDGKLGIFPIVRKRAAKRTTKNQKAGELITEAISVNKVVYRDLLVNSVLPAIRAKWPGRKQGTLFIQQDNASPHGSAEAAVANAGLAHYGWNVQIRWQPAKSPDLNVLDLGYFHVIQSLQHRKRTYNVDSLIAAVEESFAEMEIRKLEKCFLTLQAVMEQIMLVQGGNDYDLSRVKRRHFPHGVFPSSLECSEDAFKAATDALK